MKKKKNESSSFLNLSILEISKTVMHVFWSDNKKNLNYVTWIQIDS